MPKSPSSVQILNDHGEWVNLAPSRLTADLTHRDALPDSRGKSTAPSKESDRRVAYLSRRGPRVAFAGLVAAAHLVALWNLWHLRTATQAPAEQRDPVINAYIFERDRSALAAQVIDFTWTNPDIQVSDLPTMELTTDDVDTRPGVIGDISVPHPYTASSLELRHIAQQAGLAGGQVATVILSVDVQADGSVDDIRVLVSCGQLDIDDAAIRYARSLRWIPGTVRREAMAMRIRFPVTLVGAPVLIPVSGTQGAGHGSDRKPARKASAMFGGS